MELDIPYIGRYSKNSIFDWYEGLLALATQ